jgi:hypothetical protein
MRTLIPRRAVVYDSIVWESGTLTMVMELGALGSWDWDWTWGGRGEVEDARMRRVILKVSEGEGEELDERRAERMWGPSVPEAPRRAIEMGDEGEVLVVVLAEVGVGVGADMGSMVRFVWLGLSCGGCRWERRVVVFGEC